MKKIIFISWALINILFISCESDDDSSENSKEIPADFSYTSEGSTFTFTNLSGSGLNYQWDFGDLFFYSHEENPVYTYNIVGGELTVSLTVTDGSGGKGFVTKQITAPIVINANIVIDGEFDDWDEVPVSYDFTPDNKTIKIIKFWTKGEFINMYYELDSSKTLNVVDMLFNTDEDAATGLADGFWNTGAEFLYEGPVNSGTFFSHNGGSADFSWIPLSLDPINDFRASDITPINGNTNAFEIRFKKTIFGTLNDYLGFGIYLNFGTEFYPDDRNASEPFIINIQK